METPKQKAEELVDKYFNLLSWNMQNNITQKDAIECAKIAVDEIINEWKSIDGIEDGSDGSNLDYIENKQNYWQEVKNELNNMS